MQTTFCDLGTSPLANSYVTAADVAAGKEPSFPLHAYVCNVCRLVQLEAFGTPEAIFSDYAYFSSYSSSFVEHARAYAAMIVQRLSLAPKSSFVLEVASNDGYLLQHFVKRGVRVLGVEPAQNVAEAARAKGIETEVTFFGAKTAPDIVSRHGRADLIVGNNVIAHVPDLHDFIDGVRLALATGGTATFEFPHLLELIRNVEFDTIYHEHFSYFALAPLLRAFNARDLEITDVEQIWTHGGSLRVYVQHRADSAPRPSVAELIDRERAAGLEHQSTYARFQKQVEARRDQIRAFLSNAKKNGKIVAGYGAPAKAITLLSYCKIDTQLLPFTVDVNPNKSGRLLAGSHIPIFSPEKIFEVKPDIVLILAWNLREEIQNQLRGITEWGGRFAVVSPRPELIG